MSLWGNNTDLFVENSGNYVYGNPEVLNSMGLGHLLILFWTKSKCKIDKGGYYYDRTIDPNEYHIIGCDDDQRTKLLLYRSHFVGFTFRSYLNDTPRGVVDRIFWRERSEMSPNICFYYEHEYRHRDFALSCGIRSSFCFSFIKSGKIGVMEIVSTCNQDVGALHKFCESFKGFDWSLSFRHITVEEYALPEIVHLLEVVCQTFKLPLTQYWNNNQGNPYLVHQFSYRDFENVAPWCQFKYACFHMGLSSGEGPLGSSCEVPGAFFCSDITALRITQYPFAHYALNCGSIACLTIFLCHNSRPNEEWTLEFFLLAQEMDNHYPLTLLDSIWAKMKEFLPNWMVASGEQLGQVLSVKVINSYSHDEPESFKIGQHDTSLPYLEGSEYTRTLNLFENNTGQRSNSYSCEEAATGETSERVSDEAFQPRTSEEHFQIRGNTVAAERDNISKHFGRPLKDAAGSFGVSPSTFKRRCRSVGITWWQPSKSKLIDTEKGKQNVSSSMRPLQDTPVVSHRSQALEKMTVKATYNGVTIKFELANFSGISELEDNVIKRLHLERNSFCIKYQDNDNELILIGCDEDVQECMKFSRSVEKTTIKMLIHPPVNHYAP